MSEIAFADRSNRWQQAGAEMLVIPGKYLSITSFRRDGTGVATPVWFIQEGGRLAVRCPSPWSPNSLAAVCG